MTRRERAEANFRAGYNCAQSVALAFDDLVPMDRALLARMASPLGGGMGRLREVCGAVSGMLLVLGALYGYDAPGEDAKKAALYAQVQALALAFEQRHGSIVCRELLAMSGIQASIGGEPEERTADFYKRRPCPELAACAAGIVEELLNA